MLNTDYLFPTLEVMIALLVCLLCAQMFMLYLTGNSLLCVVSNFGFKNRGKNNSTQTNFPRKYVVDGFDRVTVVSHARTLLTLQTLDAKRNGIDLRSTPSSNIRSITAAYLAGCVNELVTNAGGDRADIAEFQGMTLCQHLKMDLLEANELIQTLHNAADEMFLDIYRRGASAAKHWLVKKYTPDELSLFRSITDWTLI